MTYIKRLFLFIVISFFLLACERMLVQTTPFSPAGSRLLLYLHSTSLAPPDITFVISEIKLKTADDSWIKLASGPIEINSTQLIDRQILLTETVVAPGGYKGIQLIVSAANMRGKSDIVNLAIPQPGGEVAVKANINLKYGESFVACLAWNPEKSIEKGYQFQPSIEAEPQMPSPRDLLLFISNSATNYISIIDRSIERVVAAVTVGDRPMGMVFNATKDRLYVVNSGSRTVSIMDTTQFFVLDTIQLTAGIEPTDITLIPDDKNSIEGKLYIANRLSNDVTVVSTTTKRVVNTIAVGTRPSAIASDAARKEVYVANELSNSLSIISAIDNSLAANITVDSRPAGIVVGTDKIYVFNEGSNRISIVSPSLRKVVSTISVEGPPRRGIQGFSGKLFIANTAANTLTFLNSQDVVTRTVPVGNKPIGLAGDEKRNRLYITNLGDSTVSLIDPIGERRLKELFVGRGPYGALLLER